MAARRSAREWRALVTGWQRSGTTADEYARQHGVTAGGLRWWRWKLGSSMPTLTVLPVDVVHAAPPAASSDAAVELVIRDRIVIRVTAAFDAPLLRRVVDALGAA